MTRYQAGEKPSVIFAAAGLDPALIGYKRVERAISRWKEAQRKGSLDAPAPSERRKKHTEKLKQQKQVAVEHQREIRQRHIQVLEEHLAEQKHRDAETKQKLIEQQAKRIRDLETQVQALKALCTLARTSKRAPHETNASERFALIHQMKTEQPASKSHL
ncbi:MAG: hypothetical protein LBJ43_04425 [Propionibacteriaceae bacterium]|nr:hypothetical protein [Propionibacteriaceae bacterium]